MLVLSVLGVFGYYILDYPPIGVAVPVVAALYSVAEAGLIAWSVAASLVVFGVSMFFRIRDGGEALGFLIGYESVSNIALFAAAIALGYGVRARRIRAAQQAEIVRLTEAQLAREAELRLQIERERISRELHDTVGHTMSVISLQTGVAAEAIGHDDRAAGEALDRIRTASGQSLRDLRSMLRLLRSADESGEARGVQSLAAVPNWSPARRCRSRGHRRPLGHARGALGAGGRRRLPGGSEVDHQRRPAPARDPGLGGGRVRDGRLRIESPTTAGARGMHRPGSASPA
ncbi:MAG: histidine kinase dimerization/phosphoacceptor domain-containing protein [Micropruina sp.]